MVAIQVLQNLNEGDEEDFRSLNQRLGRGAIVVARLLQEGVLEQDKRIRQQFCNSLKPLAISTEVRLLSSLIQINQPDSKSWLYNFLLSCLQENNFNESLGATIVLVQILPDDHEYVEYVSKFIAESSPEYLSCILTSSLIERELQVERHTKPSATRIKNWFVKAAKNILLKDRWIHLTQDAFNILIQVVRSNDKNSSNNFNDFDLSDTEKKFIKLFILKDDTSFESTNYESVKDYGLIKIMDWEYDCVEKISASNLSEDLSKSCNFIQIIQLILRFAKTSDRLELIEIFNWFDRKKCNLIHLFFFHLNLSLPIGTNYSLPITEQINNLNSIDDEEFHSQFNNNRKIRIIREKLTRHFNLDLWKKLVDEYPALSMRIWVNNGVDRVIEELPRLQMANIIIDRILEKPELIMVKTSFWGKFLKEVPARENELRSTLLSNISTNVIDEAASPEFYPFSLHLPLEASLLPHLLNALITRQRMFWMHREINIERQHDMIGKMIVEMVEDSNFLRHIYNDYNLDISVRASSLIMLLLHPNSNEKVGDFKEALVDFYSPNNGHWYIRSLAICLCLSTTEQDRSAQWIMNKLINVTRTDYESKKYLELVLSLWRESSQAPIQSAGVQAKWLAGEG